MIENLPPLPGQVAKALRPSFSAYILRGTSWVEIGTATPHPDGKGHQLKLHISPADGDVIELRALDIRSMASGGPAPNQSKTPRRRYNR